MKLISFFSKFTFICNISFLFFVLFSWLEGRKPVSTGRDIVLSVPYLKDLVIILGFSAIFINFLMCLGYLVTMLVRKSFYSPKWLAVTNFVFLIIEFYFFFF
ncbi:MAG TPA: hypothetical protein VMU83_17885 [Hanamia sp.]|nr:hypothetical protein [Hanamia sp.]